MQAAFLWLACARIISPFLFYFFYVFLMYFVSIRRRMLNISYHSGYNISAGAPGVGVKNSMRVIEGVVMRVGLMSYDLPL